MIFPFHGDSRAQLSALPGYRGKRYAALSVGDLFKSSCEKVTELIMSHN